MSRESIWPSALKATTQQHTNAPWKGLTDLFGISKQLHAEQELQGTLEKPVEGGMAEAEAVNTSVKEMAADNQLYFGHCPFSVNVCLIL